MSHQEIRVDYDYHNYAGGSETPKVQNRNYSLRSLIVTAIAAVLAAVMIMSICLVTFLPGVLRRMGYAKLSEIQGQQITIVPGQEYTDVEAVAVKACPSIVGVVTSYLSAGDSLFGSYEGQGQGSGIVLDTNGHILTNYHVISKAVGTGIELAKGSSIKVVLPSNVEKYYEATIVGYDSKTDLAVIKINASGLVPATIGNSSTLRVGQKVVAIGNPMGIDFMGSVTVGYISGLDRSGTGMNEFSLIQTDAAINNGNSGGALVNMAGQVIGINSLKASSSSYEGMGFAIPINEAMEVVSDLIEFNHRTGRPYLGISMDTSYTDAVAQQFGLPSGVLIVEVVEGAAAQKAGVQAYDIITHVTVKTSGANSAPVEIKYYTDLTDLLTNCNPGDSLELKVYRDPQLDGKDVTNLDIVVVLGEMDFSN